VTEIAIICGVIVLGTGLAALLVAAAGTFCALGGR
jgi:hypothetical protein